MSCLHDSSLYQFCISLTVYVEEKIAEIMRPLLSQVLNIFVLRLGECVQRNGQYFIDVVFREYPQGLFNLKSTSRQSLFFRTIEKTNVANHFAFPRNLRHMNKLISFWIFSKMYNIPIHYTCCLGFQVENVSI